MCCFCGTLDDPRQIALQFLGRQTAQAVVAAQRDDQHAHVAVERPVEPRKPASRGVSRHAGIDHLVLESFVIQTLLKQRRVRLVWR